jgi:diguanylate cyclase (GGDEF)-like protein
MEKANQSTNETEVSFDANPGVLFTIKQFVGSAMLRLSLFAIIALALQLVAFDLFNSFHFQQNCLAINKKVTSDLRLYSAQNNNMKSLMGNYDLAWCVITDENGKILASGQPLPQALQDKLSTHSQDLILDGKTIFDAVGPYKGTRYLHVGIARTSSIIKSLFEQHQLPTLYVPLEQLLGAILLQTILLLVFVDLILARPLNHLSRACLTLLLARDAYSGVTGGGLNVAGAVSEIKLLADRLKDLRRQYDNQSLAKTELSERLAEMERRLASETKEITVEYESQLELLNQRLSEFQVKEADEEFVDNLAQELQSLKSSQLVGQRILERLNNKFPATLNLATFFRLDPVSKKPALEARVGFTAQDESLLLNPAHLRIGEDIFSLGKPLEIDDKGLVSFGLKTLADEHRFTRAIYLPLSYEHRNLGFLSFFHNLNNLALQSKTKLLRNVASVSSQILYQLVIYQEELEAARTDALTGLKNRKFLAEIFPDILARAKASDEKKFISVLIMDADHFKNVNDTYGHQVGDDMLRELSKTISSRTRVSNTMSVVRRSQDYLIRYGGEEFLLVLDNVDEAVALQVSERIRQAVEARTEWPAGIARATISIGIATFPSDADSYEQLLQKADTSLYYVKKELGRNKSCAYSSVPKAFEANQSRRLITIGTATIDPSE